MGTMGVGYLAIQAVVGSGNKLVFADGATIDADGAAICPDNYHVSYGDVPAGDTAASVQDLASMCRAN